MAVQIYCKVPACRRLVSNAVPTVCKVKPIYLAYNRKQYCSRSCSKADTGNSVVCTIPDCNNLVQNAVPVPRGVESSTFDFNTRRYCSRSCSRVQIAGRVEDVFTCKVCAEEKPVSQFIHFTLKKDDIEINIPIPPNCRDHLIPGWDDECYDPVCVKCIRTHIIIQLRDRGPQRISCIKDHSDNDWEDIDWEDNDWCLYAPGFLPKKIHHYYTQRSFEEFWERAEKWVCPHHCGIKNITIDLKATIGYPHVECPGCLGRFCAGCKVEWHAGLSCQQYRAKHPDVRDEDEEAILQGLADFDARRCPQCQYIIIKDGGCDHMECEVCNYTFDWEQAEHVSPGYRVYPSEAYPSDEELSALIEFERNYRDSDDSSAEEDHCQADIIAQRGFVRL